MQDLHIVLAVNVRHLLCGSSVIMSRTGIELGLSLESPVSRCLAAAVGSSLSQVTQQCDW